MGGEAWYLIIVIIVQFGMRKGVGIGNEWTCVNLLLGCGYPGLAKNLSM